MNCHSKTDELNEEIVDLISKEKPSTLNQLLILLKERYQLTDDQTLEAITNLRTQGKIRFETQLTPKFIDTASYFKSSKSLWYWITISASIFAAIAVFLIPEKSTPWSYLRNISGLVFVLLLPGYSFLRALFPTQESTASSTKASIRNLDAIERTALSLGVSLALAAIVGLLLNYTPLGIRLTPVFWGLFILACIFATAALTREYLAWNRLRAPAVETGA